VFDLFDVPRDVHILIKFVLILFDAVDSKLCRRNNTIQYTDWRPISSADGGHNIISPRTRS